MARAGQRRSGGARTDARSRQRRRAPRPVEQGIIPVLAEIAREVDSAVRRPPTRPAVRTKFQVVALLVREERARLMADGGARPAAAPSSSSGSTGWRRCWPGPPPGTPRCSQLLAEDARVSDAARAYKATVMRAGGLEPPEEAPPARAGRAGARRRETGRAAVGDLPPAGEPVPRPGLRGRGRADRAAGPSTGRLGAARTALPVLRVRRRRRTRLHAAAGGRRSVPVPARPRAHAAPGPGRRGHGPRSPHVPARRRARASARPPRRCSPPRRPTRTRCWSWCPTWSRRTGRTRSGCGRRSVGPRSSTATASGSTGSRTS